MLYLSYDKRLAVVVCLLLALTLLILSFGNSDSSSDRITSNSNSGSSGLSSNVTISSSRSSGSNNKNNNGVPKGSFLSSKKGESCSNLWKYSEADRLNYVENNDKVEGWVNPTHGYLAVVLAQYQRAHGICGDMGEIGVHRGRYTISLAHAMNPSETIFALDLFDTLQGENWGHSGEGNLGTFLSNLKQFGVVETDLVVLKDNSLRVRPADLINEKIGPYRYVSIDGGHSAEITSSDLKLISQVLVEGGIVVLDDWFNAEWPGVTGGYFQYAFTYDLPLVPFMHLLNKLYLTTPNSYSFYRTYFSHHDPLQFTSTGPFDRQNYFGNWTVLIPKNPPHLVNQMKEVWTNVTKNLPTRLKEKN